MMLELAWQKVLKPLPTIESKVTSVIVSEPERHPPSCWNRESGTGNRYLNRLHTSSLSVFIGLL
jgi:hypothetical protein